MVNLLSSSLIYQPIKLVFSFISTPENDFQWQYGTLSSTQISAGDIKVGASFRTISHLMGHRIQSTLEVTEFEPHTRYGFKSIAGPLQSYTSYRLEIANGGTRIDVFTQAIAVNSLQVDERILEKKMRKQLNEDLALLKDLLEQRPRRRR